ncbi:hypothetical protein [Streptomyces sp. JW3]|jgi:hypothetical protein|uniref:hypothetical protein n=1 Tax=Streptomyces sp. JW3 TaxID=3456955 RepID=UPI003FA432B8
MTKKLVCVSVLAAAFLTAAPLAQAAPAPGPDALGGVPSAPLLKGLLGALEIGHPATSPQSLLPAGVLGG